MVSLVERSSIVSLPRTGWLDGRTVSRLKEWARFQMGEPIAVEPSRCVVRLSAALFIIFMTSLDIPRFAIPLHTKPETHGKNTVIKCSNASVQDLRIRFLA